jgi:hypothetical protein
VTAPQWLNPYRVSPLLTRQWLNPYRPARLLPRQWLNPYRPARLLPRQWLNPYRPARLLARQWLNPYRSWVGASLIDASSPGGASLACPQRIVPAKWMSDPSG